MAKFEDLTGKRFGRLIVISRTENAGKRISWNCICDCGKEKVVTTGNLKGKTKSCGCMRAEMVTTSNITHGLSKKSEYSIWKAMISRCYRKTTSNFIHYGGRGITVCDEWKNSFEVFYSDMGDKPSEEHTLDRIDVNGNYEPFNCKWATKKEQARNRRIRSKTGVTGVSFNKRLNKYQAKIKVEGEEFYLGSFDTLEKATEARSKAEKEYWNKSS
jgi:hypothetical protein